MKSDPIRLADDPSLSDSERELLVIGAQHPPIRYDTEAGLDRFRAGIQALADSQNASATSTTGNGAGGLNVSNAAHKLLAKIGLAIAVPMAVVATVQIANVLRSGERGEPSRGQVVGSTGSSSQADVHAAEIERKRAISPSPLISEKEQDKKHTAIAMTASSPKNATRTRRRATRQSSRISRPTSRNRIPQNRFTVSTNEASRLVGSETSEPAGIADSYVLSNQQTETPSRTITPEKRVENRPTEPPIRASQSIHPPSQQPSSIAQEMQQIARARKLVTSDPEEALELLETTAERYPRGYFVEERRALTVFALVALGKRTRAKKLAETFLRDYPKGLFSDNVRRAMEQKTPSTHKSSKP